MSVCRYVRYSKDDGGTSWCALSAVNQALTEQIAKRDARIAELTAALDATVLHIRQSLTRIAELEAHAETLSNALHDHCACPTYRGGIHYVPCDLHRAHDKLMEPQP